MDVRAHRPAALYLRILLAWLLAMQPLLGGYAAAQAANAPLTLELCRGGLAPAGHGPVDAPGHPDCCLTACLGIGAPPPEPVALHAPGRIATFASSAPLSSLTLRQAGLGPQAARAPPAGTPDIV